MTILFICEGNMMRSQMAEAFYNSLTHSHNATSAGAIAESGDHVSSRALEVMDAIGINMRSHKPKQVTPAMIEVADTIVLFPTDYMPEYARNSPKVTTWDVIDPFYHKEQGMELVYSVRDDIRKRVKALVEEVHD